MGIQLAQDLDVADGFVGGYLELPVNAVTQVFAFIGRRGSGKSYAAGRLIEQLHGAGSQVVVIDPVGVWWGLRLAADGKSKGLDVPIIGGIHGDLDLHPDAGKHLGEIAAGRRQSMVLDVSAFIKAEQQTFVCAFVEAFFHAKQRNRGPAHVVFEEAHVFCPQHVGKDQARMTGAIQRMFQLGRNFGIGGSLITQRPQAVSKAALNQAEMLVCGQLSGPQERKAIEGWVQEKGADNRDIGNLLPSLRVGEPIIWSPQWLGIFGHYRILPKATFDASATPDFTTEQMGISEVLPPLDLDQLRAAIGSGTEADVEEDEPAAPRARKSSPLAVAASLIATGRPNASAEMQALKHENAMLRARLRRVSTVVADLPMLADEIRRKAGEIGEALGEDPATSSRETFGPNGDKYRNDPARQDAKAHGCDCHYLDGDSHHAIGCSMDVFEPDVRFQPTRPNDRSVAGSARDGDASHLTAAERGIVGALMRIPTTRAGAPTSSLERHTIAIWTGYQHSAGGFANAVSLVVSRGLARRMDGASLGPLPALYDAGVIPLEVDAVGVVERWRRKLPRRAGDLLVMLFAKNGATITKEALARHAGMDAKGGGFNNYLSALRSPGLIVKQGNGYAISPRVLAAG